MTFSVYQYARLVGPTVLTTSTGTVVGTVPASTQWIVKDITVCNVGATTPSISLLFAGQPIVGSVGTANFAIAPNQTLHMTGLWILNAAETIVAFASAASSILLHISGQTGS